VQGKVCRFSTATTTAAQAQDAGRGTRVEYVVVARDSSQAGGDQSCGADRTWRNSLAKLLLPP
jgi:hypothetical protein